MRKLVVFVVALALFGCAGTRPDEDPCRRRARFVLSEYEPFQAPGDGSINGQAFLVTRGGDVKVAAGRGVTLRPHTSLSLEFIEKNVLGRCDMSAAADSVMFRFDRRQVADGDGRFEFTEIPPGKYFVGCELTWEVSGYVSGYAPVFGGIFFGVPTHEKTGGLLLQTVQVDSGASTRLILSHLAKDYTVPKKGAAIR